MKKLVFLLAAILTVSFGYAEQKIISGQVLLDNQFSLGNITVSAKHSKAVVSTDVNGKFSIACKESDVLTFKASPFKKARKKVVNDEFITVNMSFRSDFVKTRTLVDLGFVQKQDLDAVIDMVDDNSEVDYAVYTDIYDLIRAELPHVQVLESTGELIIRGKTSLQQSNSALIMLNGIPTQSIQDIRPEDIKSINVLKGPKAAIYGSRGSNGVIVITTK